MRQLSESEFSRVAILTKNSVDFTLIEPTQTGIEKSIMDATGSVRVFLKEKGIHDYSLQNQGPESKVQIKSFLLEPEKTVLSIASLYRPVTKNGDPRIWFKGLGGYAAPNDILCIFIVSKELYVLNITSIDLSYLMTTSLHNPIKEIIGSINRDSNLIAEELLHLIRNIALRGPVKALLNADTAVGRTLESLLNIKINSSKNPDYKGIELKSYRERKGNRKNLFAQVPDWQLSKFKNSAEILDCFGYTSGGDFKLYCTVSAVVRNSRGLQLEIDTDTSLLRENSNKDGIGDFAIWTLDCLHKRLLEKHAETFWIGAESTIVDGDEYFLYHKIEHTKKPIVSQFDVLLEQGIITMDHLIKRKSGGSVSEKGPLFKIKPNAINLLFPPSQSYDLIEG